MLTLNITEVNFFKPDNSVKNNFYWSLSSVSGFPNVNHADENLNF